MSDKERIKYFYEVVVSSSRIWEVENFISEQCVLKVGETIIPCGVSGMKRHLIEDVKKTYPDYSMTIVKKYQDEEYIISEFVLEGTFEGEWIGMRPNNRKLSFTGIDIDRIIHGKIVEHSRAVNTFETLFVENIIKPT